MELTARYATVSLLVSLLASPVLADARDDYKNGIEALEAGQTILARELLQRAISQAPQSKKPMIGRAYLPHFYLGKALFELGHCRAALEAWRESQRQGAVEKAKQEIAELNRRQATCEQRLREFGAALARAQTKIDEATRVSTRVGLLESDELLAAIWDEGDESLEKRHTEAVRPLWAAKDRIVQADAAADSNIAAEAEDLAAQSIAALEALATVADQQRRQVIARRDDLAQRLSRAISGAERALSESGGAASSKPGIRDLRNRLSKLARDARSQEDPTESEIVSLSDRIVSLTNGLRRATRLPPKELQVAAAAYLQGDYANVLELLDEFEARDSRIVSQVCLLRSATLHALERLGLPLPPRPASGDQEAQEEIGTAILAEPSPTPTEPPTALVQTKLPDVSEDLDDLESPDDNDDVLTALEVLLTCESLDDRLEPGASVFPPSYLEVFAEFRRIQAVEALSEDP